MKRPLALLTIALIVVLSVMGQVPNEPVTPKRDASEPPLPAASPNGTHELSAPDVEAFLDGLVPLQLKHADIAGATISVVKDGKLLFSKGYGYADVEKKKPVSAQETLFRPGSVSKLFTWTAIMQLYEQGKLDLDHDVNEYLDYKIPDAFGKPITLKHILTHTPGFEELGQFTVSPVGDGDIEVPQLTGANGKPKHWQGVGPMTFVERGGQDKLIFKPDQDGHMQMILPYPFFVGQRVGTLQNGKLLLTVLGISLGLMLLTLILWPVAWFVRRHYGRKLELTSRERLLRFLVRIAFALDLIFIAALFGLTMYGLTHLEIFSDRGGKWFLLIQIVGVLGAVGTLAALGNAFLTWTSKRRRIWSKLGATIMLLACVGVLWFALAGNLLRFSSTY